MSYTNGTGTDDTTKFEDVASFTVFYGSIIGVIVFTILYCLDKI